MTSHFQAVVLVLFGLCTKLDGDSVPNIKDGQRIVLPSTAGQAMASYGSELLLAAMLLKR